MSKGPNVFKLLEREWDREAAGPPARAALARWAAATSVLESVESPAEVVRYCQVRGDVRCSAAVLGAVLGWASDDRWAARTVLQAVLPGLAAVSRRARPLLGPMGIWQCLEELDQHVVAIAYERIAALAGASPPWPAVAIVDGTWQRLRAFVAAERRHRSRRVSLARLENLEARCEPSAAHELRYALAEAVEHGVLDQVDAWLVFASRARGVTMEDLAAELRRSGRTAWRRRQRAERLLKGTGPLLVADGAAG